MGQHDVQEPDEAQQRQFVRRLLQDVDALEHMLDEGLIESGVRRVGAEQELFLVGPSMHPAPSAMEVLERLDHPQFTTELGLFNLEANLKPYELVGDCLSRMEQELLGLVRAACAAATEEQVEVILAGILPTLERSDLDLRSMTPSPRYHQLARRMREMRGQEFRAQIKGLDELQIKHDNVMLEACNTSFQVHFQVGPEEFAPLYNLAQAVTGPMLAAAGNSPVFLRHRLWHETRVALFQQCLDTRSDTHAQRGGQPRVSFGEQWVEKSVLEIFREDIARFRVIMSTELGDPPMEMIQRGEIPKLEALCLHNGTVYRWNRPCYGVGNGKPHLRIENRVLPAGPTIVDELANAAFFFGLMCALSSEHDDITDVLDFDAAKHNFTAAAQNGLQAQLHWIGGQHLAAADLILGELLPRAEKGLLDHKVDAGDVERFLGVLRGRVEKGRTGSQWALDSLSAMGNRATIDERYRSLTAAILENQREEKPVHTWDLAPLREETEAARDSFRTVGQIMTSDLFTVAPEDLIDLAASLMDWKYVRHVPVEDNEGHLVGLVSHRQLLRLLGKGLRGQERAVAVKEIMEPTPVTVSPETSTADAIAIMRKHKVGCLPVLQNEKLVGIVTERDFIDVAARLVDRWLRE